MARVTVRDDRFVLAGDEDREFTPWGFNYDWTVTTGEVSRLEDLWEGDMEILARDFGQMRDLGANTVRVFIPWGAVMSGPGRVSEQGLGRYRELLGLAERHELRLLVTGLSLIRQREIPSWIAEATDAQLEAAEDVYWAALADAGAGHPAVFAYDLQNEPAVHSRDSDQLVEGCFDTADGTYCYVHKHLRQARTAWTEHVHERFASEAELGARWPDWPQPSESWESIAIPDQEAGPRFGDYMGFHQQVLARWSRRLATVIKASDPGALVTVGALDPAAMADAVDFHCVHLYPNSAPWTDALARVPADKPLVISEFFPLAIGSDRTGLAEHDVDLLLEVTGPRATGWFAFYYGPPENLRRSPGQSQSSFDAWRGAYEVLLRIWPLRRPPE